MGEKTTENPLIFDANCLPSFPDLHRKFPQAFLRRRNSRLELENDLILPFCVVVISSPSVLLCPMEQLRNLFACETFILLNGGFGLVLRFLFFRRVSGLRPCFLRWCFWLLFDRIARD